ncbi:FecR family protein [Dinghuibacter silviterrae]|uniref:FecR family protein n=1 Tax=Dinghuibacter silviterrae TaxID=1539049 RepID=A0A4R8DGR9_9BACT|nr:FecR family protein [Dinghuibacter silviterrae]TDW96578.1 FecR family protein [Dinghuibacter silviterrae]
MNEEKAVYIAALFYKEQEQIPLTEQERADLDEWRASYGGLPDRPEVIAKVKRLGEYDAETAANEIFQRLGILERSIYLRWISVAAAVLLLAAGGTWAYLATRVKPKPVAVLPAQPRDIDPGTTKAVLRLSDGRRITLDSVHNGVVLQQGNIKITKAGGQLTYIPTGKTAAVLYNTMTTPRGGQFRVILPDGSKVLLNAASSLTYPSAFQGQTRSVTLTGEAYFDIAPGKQPFEVSAEGVDTRVLGTRFDVMAYPDEPYLRTTLVEGKVQVAGVTLLPGREALVDHQGLRVQDGDIERAIAWTTGFFEFQDADIATIMREVSRWYDIDVVFTKGDYPGRYGGRMSRYLKLSEVLAFLEGNGIDHYRLEGRKLVVSP